MRKIQYFIMCVCVAAFGLATTVSAKSKMAISVDPTHVNNWNTFAERLEILHRHYMATRDIRTRETQGGYMGLPEFYREVSYYDTDSGKLLSRVQWQNDKPEQMHSIEVFIYDQNGKLQRDYLAAFLPKFRNAPIQTLINLHYQNDELKSFRQFDASGTRIYEQCSGRYFGEPLMLSLEEEDLFGVTKSAIKMLESDEYFTCFEHTQAKLGEYVNPLYGIKLSKELALRAGIEAVKDDADVVENRIRTLSEKITSNPQLASLYVQRGQAYFELHEFEKAIADYDQALRLDDNTDDAYFGRGMARGRNGQIKQGIADLTVYIERHPDNSRAYTKRGVRNIWLGDYVQAEADLRKAIALDANNAEAHDDLGVMLARKGQYKKALAAFEQVVNIDPAYQKGYHNLAMTQHILKRHTAALKMINKALELSQNDKNALLLKSSILHNMGMLKEAKAIEERADYMPEGNWSERFSLR